MRWDFILVGLGAAAFLGMQPALLKANLPNGPVHRYLSESPLKPIVELGIHEVFLSFCVLLIWVLVLIGFLFRQEKFLRRPSGTFQGLIYAAGARICFFAILITAPLFIWSLVLTFTRWGI